MEKKKIAKAAFLGASLLSGVGIYLADSSQAVAQTYVPTNYYWTYSCAYVNRTGVVTGGMECSGTGGNCIFKVPCS